MSTATPAAPAAPAAPAPVRSGFAQTILVKLDALRKALEAKAGGELASGDLNNLIDPLVTFVLGKVAALLVGMVPGVSLIEGIALDPVMRWITSEIDAALQNLGVTLEQAAGVAAPPAVIVPPAPSTPAADVATLVKNEVATAVGDITSMLAAIAAKVG